jgi:hypothetical protein
MQALQSQRICDMKKSVAFSNIMTTLSRAYYDSGITMPGNNETDQVANLQLLTENLYEELQAFKYLRIDELRIIIRKGVRREYGDYFHGLCIANFNQWIRAWQHDEQRTKAYAALKAAKETDYPPVMTEEQAQTAWRAAMHKQFENYKATGTLVVHFPSHQYKCFEDMGLINLSPEQKNVLYQRAVKHVLEAKKRRRLTPRNLSERHLLNAFLDRAEKGKHTNQDKEEFRQQARWFAIREFYDSLETLAL